MSESGHKLSSKMKAQLEEEETLEVYDDYVAYHEQRAILADLEKIQLALVRLVNLHKITEDMAALVFSEDVFDQTEMRNALVVHTDFPYMFERKLAALFMSVGLRVNTLRHKVGRELLESLIQSQRDERGGGW